MYDGYLIAETTVGSCIPWIQVDDSAVNPSIIWKTKILKTDSDNPIRTWLDLAHQRQKMFGGVNSEHSKGSTNNIGSLLKPCR